MEQGSKVSEHVTPLARNISNPCKDVESGNVAVALVTVLLVEFKLKIKTAYRFVLQAEETISVKTEQSSIRQQSNSQISMEQVQKGTSSPPISIEDGDPENLSSAIVVPDPSVGATSSTWAAMKTGLLNFKSNLGSKKFLRLSHSTKTSATESLDEIFQRLKRHSSSVDHLDDDMLP
ncbi:hypothetical protein PR202_gb17485 [Eleusine coracana subsp. coracana]|uniref:Uncharacterized protein n=1 Tax=Eleusine coracana subsp. coracana TaxID=191504 RepID=A0AAV5F4D8_ELECO|nr:hypothetical protein PR202_gb17485 [Eleusine coracana subsp. coracana]